MATENNINSLMLKRHKLVHEQLSVKQDTSDWEWYERQIVSVNDQLFDNLIDALKPELLEFNDDDGMRHIVEVDYQNQEISYLFIETCEGVDTRLKYQRQRREEKVINEMPEWLPVDDSTFAIAGSQL
jgi:hypothetical protein